MHRLVPAIAMAFGVVTCLGCRSSERTPAIGSWTGQDADSQLDTGVDTTDGSGGDGMAPLDAGSDVEFDGPGDASPDVPPPASVEILAPSEGSSIGAVSFTIEVALKNFHVAAFGQCDIDPCGHVRVKLDGDNCSAGSAPHNVAITSVSGSFEDAVGTATVDTTPCRTSILGREVSLRVELVQDNFEGLTPAVTDEIQLQF